MAYERRNSNRLLMGPGPSPVDPRVLSALAEPVLGHLDPEFQDTMTQTTELMRQVFDTKNRLTMPISGTGSAGMETALVNLIEPGDKVVVGACGIFGERMLDIAGRLSAEVFTVKAQWGKPIDPDDIARAIARAGRPKLVAVVHAETSTGVRQPLEQISEHAKKAGALLVVDAVTSLAGLEVPTDRLGLDLVYSGTQKCLSCPPGLSPVTVSDDAARVIRERKSQVLSWYLDLSMVQRYWTQERFYHHTAPVNMIYALHEALRLVVEEGLRNSWARHAKNSAAFTAGVSAMGLELLVDPLYRLSSLVVIKVPPTVEDAAVRSKLLSDYNIEIGGGLGDLKGKVWRVGLMGYGSQRKNVMLVLAALEEILVRMGYPLTPGAALKAAREVYNNA